MVDCGMCAQAQERRWELALNECVGGEDFHLFTKLKFRYCQKSVMTINYIGKGHDLFSYCSCNNEVKLCGTASA